MNKRSLGSDQRKSDDFEERYADLERLWINPGQTLTGTFAYLGRVWGVELKSAEPNDPNIFSSLRRKYEAFLREAHEVYAWNSKQAVCEAQTTRAKKLVAIFDAIHNSYQVITSIYKSANNLSARRASCYQASCHSIPEDDSNKGSKAKDKEKKPKPYQVLLSMIWDKLLERRYRSFVDSASNVCCMEQIITEDGRPTHAWRKACLLEDFIMQSVARFSDWDAYECYSAQSVNRRRLVSDLTDMHDTHFPPLERDRNLISFTNGIYMLRENSFHPYDSDPLPDNVSSVTYVPHSFNPELTTMPWQSIQCPVFESIATYQVLCTEPL
jgi:hypothetical protein